MKSMTAISAILGAAVGLGLVTADPAGPAFGARASAQECATDTAKDDIGPAEAQALFDCIQASLLEGFSASDVPEASEFRNWAVVSTSPFVSATHGNRFVIHYANDVAKDAYFSYTEAKGFKMPVGSILAKESFNLNKEGKVRKGPLFFMEKVADGELPDTFQWKYSLVRPNGSLMGVTGGDNGAKMNFCADCHNTVIEEQDAMFYPDEDFRVGG